MSDKKNEHEATTKATTRESWTVQAIKHMKETSQGNPDLEYIYALLLQVISLIEAVRQRRAEQVQAGAQTSPAPIPKSSEQQQSQATALEQGQPQNNAAALQTFGDTNKLITNLQPVITTETLNLLAPAQKIPVNENKKEKEQEKNKNNSLSI